MDDQTRQGPADAPHADETTISDETSRGNSTPTALLISGFGSYHTDKAGQMPYKRISLADVRALVDAPQQVDKTQAQWVIPSSLESRVHAEQAKDGKFWMLWADVDWRATSPKPMSAVASYVAALTEGADYEVYASRGATDSRQKCRILIPLNEPLCGRDWIDCQRELNALLAESGIEPDAASERPGQLCFLPNRGAWYGSISRRDGVFFDPMTTWAALIADRRRMEAEQAEALRLEREKAKQRRKSIRASQVGNGAQSLIEAFNQSYHVAEILVQARYDQRGNTFRHPNSETGSFSASVKDGRVHTLSTSDPLWSNGEGAHDAFSAFQVLFYQGDIKAAMKAAGDNWITIGSETWNQVARRKYAEDRRAERERDTGADEDPSDPQSKGQKAGYRLLTFDDFASGEPALEIVENVLPAEGTACIYGRSGTGKTFLTIDLMLAIARGLDDWFGYRVMKSPVVYLALEGAQGMRDRLEAYRKHASCEIPDSFRILNDRFRLDSDDDRAALVSAVRDCGLVKPVTVIDTMTRAAPGLDLNGPKDMGTVISAVDDIQRELGGLVISVYHATIKGNGGAEATEMGHSSLRGALDASIVVYEPGESSEIKAWSTKKLKDAASGVEHRFSLEAIEVRKNQWGNPKTSCSVLPVVDMPFESKPINEEMERRALADQLENYVVSGYYEGKRFTATNLRDDPPTNMTTREVRQSISVLQSEGRLVDVSLPKSEKKGSRKAYLHPIKRIPDPYATSTEESAAEVEKEAA